MTIQQKPSVTKNKKIKKNKNYLEEQKHCFTNKKLSATKSTIILQKSHHKKNTREIKRTKELRPDHKIAKKVTHGGH